MRTINITDLHTSATVPVTLFTEAGKAPVYANDTAFETALTAAGGSIGNGYWYVNSTVGQIRYYFGGDWHQAESELNNFSAGGAPAVGNDNTEGYEIGSMWYYNNLFYVAKDVSTGAAVWQQFIDTNTTQTMTNKTLTSPVLNTPDINDPDINGGTASDSIRVILPKNTTSNLNGLTDVQGLIDYDTDKDRPVFNNGAGWEEFYRPQDVSTKSASYTITDTDNIGTLLIDDTGSDRVIDLPTVGEALNLNRIITIKNTSTDKGKVNVDGEGGELIDEWTDIDLDFKDSFITVQSDGAKWHIIGTNLTVRKKPYTLAVSGTNWTTTDAHIVPFRDMDGNWYASIYIQGSYSDAVAFKILTLTGVTFANNGINGTCSISRNTTGRAIEGCRAEANGSTLLAMFVAAGSLTFHTEGDAMALKEKPTHVE